MRARNSSAALLCLLAAVAASPARAAPVHVPYVGHLERDGVPETGDVDLRVGLFASAQSGPGCLAGSSLSGCGVWADEVLAVPVSVGRFSVVLGDGLDLDDALFEQPLFLGVAVRQAGGPWTALQGMQRIETVPRAARSGYADPLVLTGELSVGGNATVGGDAAVAGGLSMQGALDVSAGATVDGELFAGATLERPSSVTSTYLVSQRRYLAEAPYTSQGLTRSSVRIPDQIMRDYCGDEDGCRVTLRMRDWEGPDGTFTSKTACSLSFHFNYGELNGTGTQARWRREPIATPGNIAMELWNEYETDGNGTVNHIARNHDCYFTDGDYSVPGQDYQGDQLGLYLLNWNALYQPLCQLIIDD